MLDAWIVYGAASGDAGTVPDIAGENVTSPAGTAHARPAPTVFDPAAPAGGSDGEGAPQGALSPSGCRA
jgi:hypothetical protein